MRVDHDPVIVSLATGRETVVWPNGCMSVELPISVRPTFGAACVVCGLTPPSSPSKQGDVPSWTWSASVLLPSRFVPTPPACQRCAVVCAVTRVLGLVGIVGVMVCSGVIAKMLAWAWPARIAVSIAAPVAVGLLWSWAVPAWFKVGRGVASQSLAYTFRRRENAAEFAYKNAAPDRMTRS